MMIRARNVCRITFFSLFSQHYKGYKYFDLFSILLFYRQYFVFNTYFSLPSHHLLIYMKILVLDFFKYHNRQISYTFIFVQSVRNGSDYLSFFFNKQIANLLDLYWNNTNCNVSRLCNLRVENYFRHNPSKILRKYVDKTSTIMSTSNRRKQFNTGFRICTCGIRNYIFTQIHKFI